MIKYFKTRPDAFPPREYIPDHGESMEFPRVEFRYPGNLYQDPVGNSDKIRNVNLGLAVQCPVGYSMVFGSRTGGNLRIESDECRQVIVDVEVPDQDEEDHLRGVQAAVAELIPTSLSFASDETLPASLLPVEDRFIRFEEEEDGPNVEGDDTIPGQPTGVETETIPAEGEIPIRKD